MRVELTPEARTESLIEALPYIQRFRGQVFVIKYGGSAMEDEHIVEKLLRDVVFLEAVGINPVLVHGGGKVISARMRDAGMAPHFVNGLRVTDEASVRIVEEILDGEINPKICRTIERHGGKCIGVSGKTVFAASRMPPQQMKDGSFADLGFVGEVSRVQAEEVRQAIAEDVVPVISPIGSGDRCEVLNINADVAAAGLAGELKAAKLIYVSDVPGIMRDPSQPDSLIPTIRVSQTAKLIREGVIEGGMIPKVESAISALQCGVQKIHMLGGQIQHCLLLEIFTNSGIGTELVS